MVISGCVQMVGFRFYAKNEARRLGIAGYVRNLPDGTLEVMAEGELESIHNFIASMRKGPPSASVEHINIIRTSLSEESFPDFSIRW